MSMNPGMKEDAEKIRQRRKLVRIYGASPVFGVKWEWGEMRREMLRFSVPYLVCEVRDPGCSQTWASSSEVLKNISKSEDILRLRRIRKSYRDPRIEEGDWLWNMFWKTNWLKRWQWAFCGWRMVVILAGPRLTQEWSYGEQWRITLETCEMELMVKEGARWWGTWKSQAQEC